MIKNKITLFIMSEKGYSVLTSIVNKFGTHVIEKVITDKDNHVQKDFYDEITSYCKENNLHIHTRTTPYEITTEYSIVVSWKWLIHGASKLIVLHDSLLPHYKGFAPVVSMLINEENHIGATAFFASEKYDDGDIIIQRKHLINYPLKIADAIKIISFLYSEIIIEIILQIINGESINSTPQVSSKETYSLWLDDEDYSIDWRGSATFIKRFIDSVGLPYRGAKTKHGSKEIRVFDASVVDDKVIENRVPGKVFYIDNGMPVIVCGNGLLMIKNAKTINGDDLIPWKLLKTRLT